MRKFTAVTTFNQKGLDEYARRFINSFAINMPIQLMAYAEDCTPEPTNNVEWFDLAKESPELVAFKTKWANEPKANGDVTNDPVRSKRRDAGKGFKWDAVRFSHKIYSILAAAKRTDADVLIWMDADTVCHSPMPIEFLDTFIPEDKDICFLGRKDKFSECGFYSMNLRSNAVQVFLKRFQWMYDDAENGIFQQDEWHDSFIFDIVRRHTVLNELDWSSNLITGEGHPFINTDLGKYLDHLKGKRKEYGKSLTEDLKIKREESYWQ